MDPEVTSSLARRLAATTLEMEKHGLIDVDSNDNKQSAKYANVPRDSETNANSLSRVFTIHEHDDNKDLHELIQKTSNDNNIFAEIDPDVRKALSRRLAATSLKMKEYGLIGVEKQLT